MVASCSRTSLPSAVLTSACSMRKWRGSPSRAMKYMTASGACRFMYGTSASRYCDQWRAAASYDAELAWCERVGRDFDDGEERRVEEDSEEDEDTVVVEELPPPPLQRPKCGMLGAEPVRVLTGRRAPKAWPLTRSLASGRDAWPAERLADYAFDAGKKSVKVYVRVPFAVTDECVCAEFDDELRLEVADAAAATRYYFRVALAHAVSTQHCKAAAKRGDVVVTLRKADPEDAWLTLASTEVAGNYF